MSGGFGTTTLGGDVGGQSSWGRHIDRRIERGQREFVKVWYEAVLVVEVYCFSSAGLIDGAR